MRWTPYKPIIDAIIASFDDGLPDRELHTLEVEISPYQSGTGDPSSENIRPIYGWKKMNVSVNGSNQWDGTWKNGKLNADGTEEEAGNVISKDYIPVKGSVAYCFHADLERVSQIRWYDINQDLVGTASPSANDHVGTAPADASFVRFQLPGGFSPFSPNEYPGGADKDKYVSIGYPSKKKTYEPYIGSVTVIDWEDDAGTVYGGKLDVLTGLLTVTKGYIASYNSEALPGAWISDRDVYVAGGSPTVGAEVVYDLAEPVEYELDPVEIKTLEAEGLNNIFADTGKILKCYYYIDTSYFRRYFMINTGYILLDGGNIDLSTSDPQLITGAWDRTITAINTGKPIWAYNTKYGTGKPLSPVPVFCWYLSATSIVIVGATLHIIVGDDDYCVVQDVAPSVGEAKSEETKKKSK